LYIVRKRGFLAEPAWASFSSQTFVTADLQLVQEISPTGGIHW